MKHSDLNEYIQTGAAIVAIVGILLLGYEVKQSNNLATQQAESQSWTNWMDYFAHNKEAGTSETFAKAVSDPENLTLAERRDLHFSYMGLLYLFISYFDVFSYTDHGLVEIETKVAIAYLSRAFAYPYGRAWLHEHGGDWLPPAVMQRVLARLEALPEHYTPEYFNLASVRLAAMRREDAQAN